MQNHRISSRYAKALLDLAIERNELNSVYTQFVELGEMIDSSPELSDLMQTPVIPTDKKKNVLLSLMGNEGSALSKEFIGMVLGRKREGYLRDIIFNLRNLYNEKMNIVPATISSAKPLTAEQRARIVAMVTAETGTEVELEENVDPSLIGGFILSIKDKQIDASVSSKLRDLRKEFIDNPYQVKY